MRMRDVWLSAGLVVAAAAGCTRAIEVRFIVADDAGTIRKGGVVTSGVPFARGAVRDLKRLSVSVGEKHLPAQFIETAPWDDGSVRWALMDTQADVPGGAHVYNERTGEYLGETDRAVLPWKPAEPIIPARLPYRVTGLRPRAKVARRRVEYQITLDTTGQPGIHAVRIDVYGPDGEWYHHYSRNVTVQGGRSTGGFRLALNERKGTHRITARDAVTGLTANTTFTVR